MTEEIVRKTDKIVIYGAAGLVGQNLAALLVQQGFTNLVGIDKHPVNTPLLRALFPQMKVIEADLAQPGAWEDEVAGAKCAAMLQAQIGGESYSEFVVNNIISSKKVLDASKHHGLPYLVHVSSSAVNSMARDHYSETKRAQEVIVAESGVQNCILRPTLMFGWFDRKHIGWLSRFMQSVPIFPVPGLGRYIRQPLYAWDFCRVILRCIEIQPRGIYDISGTERIYYIDMIRKLKRVTGAAALITPVPYGLFWLLLKGYAMFDPDPPFTTKQLKALVTPDEFALSPWWDIFNVTPTPFDEALWETFRDPRYSSVVLEF